MSDLSATAPSAQTSTRVHEASVLHILSPKWRTVRARARNTAQGHTARRVTLGIVGLAFWGVVFGIVYRLLLYFKNVPEIGLLLAGKLLGLVLLSFFGLLLLSNIITALSTFFLARDLELLAAAPVDWKRLYGAKLLETTLNSSWMVTLMAVPIFSAYGLAYDGGWWFPLVVLAAFVPFLLIPAALGSMITLLLVNVFPARRTKEILGVLTILAAAGVVLLVRLLRPEQLVKPEGFHELVDFITMLRTPAAPWLPSELMQSAVLQWLQYEPRPIAFVGLWGMALALIALGAAAHRAWYPIGYSKSQEGRGTSQEALSPAAASRMRAPSQTWRMIGIVRRELALKEIRLFFRDTTQWSQLILLAVIVAVYVFNIQFLPLRGFGMTFFLVNVVPFLNMGLAGFVLASIAARFIFPAVSLEGQTWWLIRASPISPSDLLIVKYWVGTMPLLVLAIALVLVTDVLLKVSLFMTLVSVGTIALLTIAIASLALVFGTLFPQFETENAAQIPTSFGGLLFMMSSIALIGAVIVFEAQPVYSYLAARTLGERIAPADMIGGFIGAGLLCVLCTMVSIRVAIYRLGKVER